jgi:hypothetical protein
MAERPVAKHGRTQFLIEGEGPVKPIISPRLKAMLKAEIAGVADAAPVAEDPPERAFRFCRLFPTLPKFEPDEMKLIDLGKSLEDISPGPRDSEIPAGFTYFGQFVDHDITFDRNDLLPGVTLKPEDILSGRSPSLELDSVYGAGPIGSPSFYEADKIHLKIGMTTGRTIFGTDIVNTPLPHDLPRLSPTEPLPKDQKRANIGDPRNDENLIVAQTHLAFLKFHNKIVDLLPAGTADDKKFDEARKTVVQHYQSIVLHDFVKRLALPSVFESVIKDGRKAYAPKAQVNGKLAMPVEFSVAIYRVGHSLIRSAYDWNMVFSSGGRAFTPDLGLFFRFSQLSGAHPFFDGLATLPTDWIVDWRRMYDFSEQPGGSRHPQMNVTRLIDTHLADGLQSLPEFALALQDHLKSLAVRNLLRGRQLGLPTGQDVAKKLGITPLTPAEVASGPNAARIAGHGFDVQTPLWFYMLKEAEVKQGGLRMGELGSRILVETFHGLIAGSDHSILKTPGWKPTLTSVNPDHYSMTDLLTLVNELNPLGDGP